MRLLSEDLDLAPIHLRAIAFLLDASILVVLVLMVGSFGVSSGAGLGAVAPVMIIVAAVYHIGFLAGVGATPGKTAMGLYVVGRDGSRPRLDTAVLRFLLYFALGIPFPFGSIANIASMLADEERRTLPDRFAGTLVLQIRREE
jgi:uncharacterized RDD family membrane protein YckC